MNEDLNIDLSGIPDAHWLEREERCAVCRRFFDDMRDEAMAEGEDDAVPLLLWRQCLNLKIELAKNLSVSVEK